MFLTLDHRSLKYSILFLIQSRTLWHAKRESNIYIRHQLKNYLTRQNFIRQKYNWQKIYLTKNIFDKKIYLTKNIFDQKYIRQKIYSTKKYIWQKNVFLEKYIGLNMYSTKNIFKKKYIWQKYIRQKIYLTKNIFDKKYICDKKYIRQKNIFNKKYNWQKIYSTKNIFDKKIYLTKNNKCIGLHITSIIIIIRNDLRHSKSTLSSWRVLFKAKLHVRTIQNYPFPSK